MKFRSCKHTTRLISDTMERRLGFREWLEMRIHLLLCVPCNRYTRQQHFLRRAVEEAGGQPQGAELREETKKRIKNELGLRSDND